MGVISSMVVTIVELRGLSTTTELFIGVHKLSEQNLERLLHFLKISTLAIISPIIGPRTLQVLGHDPGFINTFAQATGERPMPGVQINPQAIQSFNDAQTARLKALKIPQIEAPGHLWTPSLHKPLDMEKVGVFHNISLASSIKLAQQFYQLAFIYIMRGNAFLYQSDDGQSFGIEDVVHSIQAPVIHGKQFSLSFTQGADNAETIASMESLIEQVVMPDPAGIDDADMELQVWTEFLRAKIEQGDYRSAQQGVGMVADILSALVAHSAR